MVNKHEKIYFVISISEKTAVLFPYFFNPFLLLFSYFLQPIFSF